MTKRDPTQPKGDSQMTKKPRITNGHFKMPKQVKRLAATIVDSDARAVFRQSMVEAVVQSLIKPEKEKKAK